MTTIEAIDSLEACGFSRTQLQEWSRRFWGLGPRITACADGVTPPTYHPPQSSPPVNGQKFERDLTAFLCRRYRSGVHVAAIRKEQGAWRDLFISNPGNAVELLAATMRG